MRLKIKGWPRRLSNGLPLLLWMGLIFALSSRSRLVDIESDVDEKFFYKTAHFTVYAILAWLWWRFLTPHRRFDWPPLFLAWGLTTLYGISDEIHQLFVPGRHGQLADVLFDSAGALAMILLIRRLAWLRRWPDSLPFIRLLAGKRVHPKF